MSFQLIVRPEAEGDLAEAFDWYDERRAGLGTEFLAEVDAALEKAIENPLRFAALYHHVRRALVRRFPYKIFFYIEANRVVVIGVIHAKRHPRVWQGRV
ncbi:MAG: type II toxin-antitoxin system RelE/ParE family toxin [Verrucomicrobiae bacterium]|nr:type II toxin-antitoxin system RelE/ParE family toxin [Verrucomicrobiae bacterium]